MNAGHQWSMAPGSIAPDLPLEHEQRWYAAHTSANHEKRVAEQLAARNVEHFLPTYSSMRRWKDRSVKLQLPLFPGYVFVRMALRERLQILNVRGVATLVSFCGIPACLPDPEIEALRASLARGVPAEPHPYLVAGKKVCLLSGPLAGLTGILVRRKSGARFVVSVNLIQRSLAVELNEADLAAAR